MIIDAATRSSDAFYAVMIQAIVPRPIAWVLSLNENQSFNVAPFSFFNGVASEPPLLMISVGRKADDSLKDTRRNIEERDDFVVHIPPVGMASAVSQTSAPLLPGVSEIDFAGLKTVEVDGESLPRLVGPRVAMFCRKHRIIEVGTDRAGLILGEIRKIWLDDGVVSEEKGRITLEPAGIDPLSRLGGKYYSGLGGLFEVERPR